MSWWRRVLLVWLDLLEEFQLDVVRVAEADQGGPERIMVQIGRYAMGVQGFGQLLQLGPARYAKGKMVQADTPLTEAILWQGSGQRRAEHQAVMAAELTGPPWRATQSGVDEAPVSVRIVTVKPEMRASPSGTYGPASRDRVRGCSWAWREGTQ